MEADREKSQNIFEIQKKYFESYFSILSRKFFKSKNQLQILVKLLESRINFPKKKTKIICDPRFFVKSTGKIPEIEKDVSPNITCAKRRTNFTAIKNDGGARD